MPIFSKDKKSKTTNNGGVPVSSATDPIQASKPKLVFHCQMAQGSPTGIISDFTNVKELYQKIAACYEISAEDIIFCTLNTHKVDMARLLGGQLGLEDFIFAHIRGRPKVVDIDKVDDALGLTITDNGAGLAFIKAIKEGSIISKIDGIYVGDHIEKINDVSMVGSRHFEVAKALKDIPKSSTFSLRLVEPEKSPFGNVDSKSSSAKKPSVVGTGKSTLRLNRKGPATMEMPDDVVIVAIEKINSLLENFLGISDAELAQSIWELGCTKANPSDFMSSIRASDLREFNFTDTFIFELWGAITDAKQGRLNKPKEFNENF